LEHFEGIESYTVKLLPIVKAYADKLVELINRAATILFQVRWTYSQGSIFSFIGAVSSSSRGRSTVSKRPLPGYPNAQTKNRMKKEIVWTFPPKISTLKFVAGVGHFDPATSGAF